MFKCSSLLVNRSFPKMLVQETPPSLWSHLICRADHFCWCLYIYIYNRRNCLDVKHKKKMKYFRKLTLETNIFLLTLRKKWKGKVRNKNKQIIRNRNVAGRPHLQFWGKHSYRITVPFLMYMNLCVLICVVKTTLFVYFSL
jgi:hypothetical protein